jgi:hypothetical protein
MLFPQYRKEFGEGLVEPNLALVPAGEQVAKPLVRQLVRDKTV